MCIRDCEEIQATSMQRLTDYVDRHSSGDGILVLLHTLGEELHEFI